MQAIGNDLRYGLRVLLKRPGFTIIAVLIIALGVGANTSIFNFVNVLLLRPIEGVSDPTALVQLLRTADGRDSDRVSYRDWLDFQEQNRTLTGMAMHGGTSFHLSTDRQAERLDGAMVTGGYFDVLGVEPALGRLLASSDAMAEGANPVVVLSHSIWRTRFDRDPNITGKTVTLNGLGYTVVGVAAEGFNGVVTGERCDLWIPITMWRQADPEMVASSQFWDTDWRNDRDSAWLKGFGRLKPGISLPQAQADITLIAHRLAQNYPETNRKVGVKLAAELGLPPYVRTRVSQFIKLPTIIAGVVLLIVCMNIAGMMLARSIARQRDISIRLALGASHWRIVRQLLMESILLAVAGGLLGLMFGLWLSNWLRLSLPENYFNIPLDFNPKLDSQVFGFVFIISLLTGMLVGMFPALQASKINLVSTLQGQHNSGLRRGRIRLRETLVVAQIALSFILLVAAGLCIRTLRNARAIDTGFNTEQVLTARIDIGRQNYTEAQGQSFYQQLIERIDAVSGVQKASLALNVPLAGLQTVTRVHPEGRPPESGRPQISYNIITPGYFETVGIPLLFGRHFSEQDNRQSPLVAIVNEGLAMRFWPGENPIGNRFRFGDSKLSNPPIEIVGVAKETIVSNLFAPPRMYLYMPLSQHYQSQIVLHLRTDRAPEQFITAVQREIGAIDRSLPVYDVKTFANYVNDALIPQRLTALLISGFGALAMILAAIGLYGRMAYDVEQRTHEIGIRMALGAQPSDVLRLILREGMTLTLTGLAVGLVAALAMTRLIKGLLFGVSPTDPLTIAVIIMLLAAVAITACYVPARRAIQVDPIKSLRSE
jgi:predicted permease